VGYELWPLDIVATLISVGLGVAISDTSVYSILTGIHTRVISPNGIPMSSVPVARPDSILYCQDLPTTISYHTILGIYWQYYQICMGEKSKSTLQEVFETRFHTVVCTTGNTAHEKLLESKGVSKGAQTFGIPFHVLAKD
jgi:hypothetical protein